MVLGLGSKKKGATVKVEFQIHVQEIKPWKTGGSVPLVVQWQRGDNRYGKTRSVLPSPDDGGKLVFNESIKLPAKLVREPEGKGRNAGIAKFQKKTIVFTLQEATTDLQLARCVLDLAEYGDLDSKVPASIPLAVGKKVATGSQTPTLYLAITPSGKKEERSFASRVSFGSSTPRSSISKAPEKAGSSGKSRVEPALDEDTKRSIVAALLTDDDDDNVSLESFTDDEGSATPVSGTAKSSTPLSESSSQSSTTPPMSDNSRSSTSTRPQTPESVNKWSSSRPQFAMQTTVKAVSPMHDSSHGKPTAAQQGPVAATMSSPPLVEERRRPIPTKHGPAKAAQSRTSSVEADSSRTAQSSAPAITQLFSTDPLYKVAKGDPSSVLESGDEKRRELTNSSASPVSSVIQANKVNNQSASSEGREEGSRAALFSPESSSNKGNKSSAAGKEALLSVTNVTDSSSGQIKTTAESVGAERGPSPKGTASEKERQHRHSLSLPPASAAAAAAAAAASAYVANRTFRPTRGSSAVDFSYESSEESFSETSNSGRSPPFTPLRHPSGVSTPSREKSIVSTASNDESDVLKISKSNSETTLDAKHSYNEGERNNGKRSDSQSQQKQGAGNVLASKSLDLRNDILSVSEGKGVLKVEDRESRKEEESDGTSVLGSARANLAKVEKKALDELRTKLANAEAKFLNETKTVEKLEGELRDVAALEVALFSVVAEHGNSSHKLHSPARRLARLYMYAYKHWIPERRAGTAKNCVSGLVTVAKACGTDVSRLSFWWSNIVALRCVITQAFDTGSSSLSLIENTQTNEAGNIHENGSPGWARARRSLNTRSSLTKQVNSPRTAKLPSNDWQEYSTFTAALEKIEGWIYSKIVESLWWQAMIPRMQKSVDASVPTSPTRGIALLSPSTMFGPEFTSKAKEDLNKLAGDVTGIFVRKPSKVERNPVSLPELGDARQGNMSVEVWKKAIMEALRRLCPVRGAGHDCGCLPMLIRMAIEGCVARLDVALFNAILREPDDDVPTDPLSDPVSDSSVLPISPGGLTFGGGSQLKNVVVTWSTYITGLVSIKEPTFITDVDNGGKTENLEDSEKAPKFFNLIKATGDLLMLPKDILMDKAIRKEELKQEAQKSAALFVMLKSTGDILQLPKDMLMDKSLRREICPMLSLQLIRRILVNFGPDEFAPDPISPSLLAALNAEATIEKQRQGEADEFSSFLPMAKAPPVTYVAPSAIYVWSWIGEASHDPNSWGCSNNSVLRKGYTSDEDLDVMQQLQKSSGSDKLEFLMGSSRLGSAATPNGTHSEDITGKQRQSVEEGISIARRFQLLQRVWTT